MNTAKRERIIKNLYDLQCLDSWEDSEHFMEAVEAIRIYFVIRWVDLLDIVENECRASYGDPDPEENYKYRILRKHNHTSEVFADLTNCGMKFYDFRALCLEYMDFSQLI